MLKNAAKVGPKQVGPALRAGLRLGNIFGRAGGGAASPKRPRFERKFERRARKRGLEIRPARRASPTFESRPHQSWPHLFRSGGKYPRPVCDVRREPLADWIRADVVCFQLPIFALTNAKIEKIALPLYAGMSRRVAFPIGNHRSHRFVGRKCQQSMSVIRHEEEQAGEPPAGGVIVPDRFHHEAARGRSGELMAAARCAVNRDEEQFARWHPRRNIMRQVFSRDEARGGEILWFLAVSGGPLPVTGSPEGAKS